MEPFDQAVNHLNDYLDRLRQDRAESESKRVSGERKLQKKVVETTLGYVCRKRGQGFLHRVCRHPETYQPYRTLLSAIF